MSTVKKICSGGQTGVDQMGLRVGKKLGLETGGTAPKYFKTENGSDWTLKEFGLVEDDSEDYNPRTLKNVQDSDGTVLFGDPFSPGSKLTIRCCRNNHKPIKINPTKEELKTWLVENKIQTLNVAGNRGSKLSQQRVMEFETILTEALV